eukprot:g5838.t1 g5838   contig20:267481-269540(+)
MSTRCLISILAASFLSSDINNILGTGTGNPSSIFAAAAANKNKRTSMMMTIMLCRLISTFPPLLKLKSSQTGGSDKCLFQSDFDHGTHIISESVAAPDVTLHLNGYTIQQDASHALLQRFFAVIELASAPFISGAGPAQFVSDALVSATNFKLQGPGVIGRSSHHGIHGNNNVDVVINNVVFRDFEVAAVSLNNVKGLDIVNCNIPHNRQDVPILGSFSAAKQILPYLKALKSSSYSMPLRGRVTTVTEVYDAIVSSIANVYRDVMNTGFIDEYAHPDEYKLFNNPHRVVDGPCYAFLVHGKGPAVGGVGFAMTRDIDAASTNVNIANNNIENVVCFTNEVPASVVDGIVQNDARGAIVQLVNTFTNEYIAMDGLGRYTGNVITDAQIMVAKAIRDGVLVDDNILQTGVNTIDVGMIDWAMNPELVFDPKFRCNGDSMHHVVKGSIIIRVEDTQGFSIKGNTINAASVVSGPASSTPEYFSLFQSDNSLPDANQASWTCETYHFGASIEDGSEQQLANLRGISVAAVSSKVKNGNGNAIGKIDASDIQTILFPTLKATLQTSSLELISKESLKGY